MQSLVSITRVLDKTCRPEPDVETCSKYLEGLADELISQQYCMEDYQQQNSVVVQAYVGMRAYKTVHDAVCLTDPSEETEQYCFASAATDLTTASNVYMYYLPLNSSYPPRATPSCNSCTNATMAVFQAATSDRTNAIASTYGGAAAKINEVCGNNYVNATLAAAVEENSSTATMGHMPTSSALLLLLPLITTVYQWLS